MLLIVVLVLSITDFKVKVLISFEGFNERIDFFTERHFKYGLQI